MLRPPATLRVAMRAGIALQAGDEANETYFKIKPTKFSLATIFKNIKSLKIALVNIF
ncbi:MAG: hypothetical protein WAV31_03160 [Candidatus Moraniibacteriota bacterium]